MKKQIGLIGLEAQNEIRDTARSFLEVLNYQLESAEKIDRALSDINQILPTITKPFDPSDIVKRVSLLEKNKIEPFNPDSINKSIAELKKAQSPQYDDSMIIRRLESMEKALGAFTGVGSVDGASDSMASNMNNLQGILQTLTKNQNLLRAEIKSLRRTFMGQIDGLHQEINLKGLDNG